MGHFKEFSACLIFTLIILARIWLVGTNPDVVAKIKDGLESGSSALDVIANLKDTKAFEKLGKLAGALGAVGGIISFALVFVDVQSAEMTFMKKKFAEVNGKLDIITKKLDNVENIIKLENQRSAYIQYANKITTGHRELQKFLSELQKTKCSNIQSCKLTRSRISERYLKYFDVKGDLFAILSGAINGTAPFGDPLLNLVKTTFKCDVGKIESYSSSMFFLAFKAQQVVLAYEGLTGSNYSIVQSMDEWLELIYQLREATNKVKKSCYNKIKSFMNEDIIDKKYQVGVSSNEEANKKLKAFLENKYKWLDWVVYSYGAYGGEKHWVKVKNPAFRSMPKDQNDRKRNIIAGAIDKHGTYDDRKYTVLNAIDEIIKDNDFGQVKGNANKILNMLVDNLKKKNVWKFMNTINVLRKYEGLQTSGNNTTFINKEYDLFAWQVGAGYRGSPRGMYKYKVETIRLIIILKSKEMPYTSTCGSLTCNKQGSCIYLPYSSAKLCQCKKYYEGKHCKKHDTIELAKTMADMFKATLKVPMLSDIKYDIENMQKYIGISVGKIQTSVSELEIVFQDALKNLVKTIKHEFKWFNMVTQYSSSIRKISYYSYLFENLPKSHPNNAKKEGRKIAAEILASNGIEKWLYEINFLFLGRSGLPLVSHQPLISHLIEKYRNQPCDKRYKSATNGTWKELVLLQQIGFMVWSQALEYAGRHTQQVASLYDRRLAIQVKKLKEISCRYEIANANQTRCANGEYLNADLKTVVKCKKNNYISGPVNMTSCENRPSLCKPCNCNPSGSKTLQCENGKGNCTCKPPFYGKKCQNRGCSLHKQFECSKGECIPKSQKCDYLIDCKNDADEKYCSERCSTSHTSWRRYYGRERIFLWPNNKMECGGSGLVLQKFKLEKRAYWVRYKYTCCKLFSPPTICKNRQKSNKWFSTARHSLVSLAKQSVNCGTNSFINKVHLKKSGASFRYTYNCCELKPEYRSCCKKMVTEYSAISFGVAKHLGIHSVQCPHRYFISSFRLTMDKSRKKWRHNFICCKILPQ